MALCSPSSISLRDLVPRDSPPADSSAPTSKGGSSTEAKTDVRGKTKEGADHLLAKLEKEGVEIDGKIASIIDTGMARIKAEAVREKNKKTKRDGMTILRIIGCMAIGFIMGAECYEYAFHAANDKRGHALDEE